MQTKRWGIVKIRSGALFGLAGLLAVVALLLNSPVSRASEGYVIYDAQDVQGLHITVLASPNPISVGKIHLFVRLARPSGNSEEPYRGADLLVEFYHISGPGADQSASYVQRRDLVAPESEPGTYELSDSIQNEGDYQVTLTLRNEQKPISTSFTFNAKPEPDDRFLSVLLLSLFPLFLAWLIWMYLKRPGPKPDQPDPSTEISAEEPLAASHPEH
jgi:hypothetical protein